MMYYYWNIFYIVIDLDIGSQGRLLFEITLLSQYVLTQYINVHHFPNTCSYALCMWRGVEGTPNWVQNVMTICVVLFRGNVGFLSLIRGEYIFYAANRHSNFTSFDGEIIFEPIGLPLNREELYSGRIFKGPYYGAVNGSFPRIWWFLPQGFPHMKVLTHPYIMCTMLLSLQLSVMARRGVLGGDPCTCVYHMIYI